MATHQLPQLASTLKTPGSEEASIESKTEVVELEGKTDEQVRASFTYEQEQRLLRKVDWHLLPLLILAYLLKNLDVNNISYIKVIATGKPSNILTELNMSLDDFSWVSTIYTIPFILAEIPSNLFVKRFGPRAHIFRIIILWSIAASCHAAATNGAGLYAARFFLGLFEAGLYPGILLILTYWYRPDELGVRMTIVGMLGQFSGILSALLAWAFEYADGKTALSAWRLMFLVEGVVGFVLAAFVWKYLPDFPDNARFLTSDERRLLVLRLPSNVARATDENFSKAEILSALRSPLLWSFTGIQLFSNLGAYGLSFWLPSIIASFGFTTTQSSQLLNIPPAVLGIALAVYFAWLSDRTFSIPRPIYTLGSKAFVIPAFIGLTVVTNKPALYALIIIATAASTAYSAVLMPWRAQTLAGSSHAAFTFAFQNSIAQLGGVIGPQIFRSKYSPRYTVPYAVSLGFLAISTASVVWTWWLSYDIEKETRRVAKIRFEEGKEKNVVSGEELRGLEKL